MSRMLSRDAVSAHKAECYITIKGNRYNFMQLKEFEAKLTVNVQEVPILGRTMVGHKPTTMTGEWSGTAYYNQSVLRELAKEYKDTGVAEYFDIQVTNEDPATLVGPQTVVLKDCLSSESILAKFTAGEDVLEEELSGTFDDFEMPNKFKVLNGML
ncbi:phage tail tube protein [Bacilliculturomica massiliensis]|uniref:phage tail tube protein n=1 Tax=Bacilliculturomica massiliensis TaxID=1917867 RepID=UPI0010307D9A|nr:phage tail tube protein [Bacilliculturomica massiliensis]